ncbi:hypothetical protein [Methyloprofundus sp.]|uniref:hypothetical protein n=1 Tax=Methyloprofundus sp. TaxID=2020875 RepID=UPI003D1294CF
MTKNSRYLFAAGVGRRNLLCLWINRVRSEDLMLSASMTQDFGITPAESKETSFLRRQEQVRLGYY